MAINVCPAAIVAAPCERVWALLADPASYDRWWDAGTERIEPEGPAQPGQTVHARTRGLGRWWEVTTTVEMVDASRHQIRLRTMLPLGITAHNHITCAPLDERNCRVQFG